MSSSRWRSCSSPPPYSYALLLVALGGPGSSPRSRASCWPASPLLPPLARALVRTARARPRHTAVVAGALAGPSFAYGA
ncbi:hypothetical protein [Streptomyces canus]|uniref:hypothetical protein n=1 Tax=Streptomyces canus TaxID=58343 RepID=UPI002787BFAC|nr:hypothetical protein [Streptomyces canus]MDQ0762592.1 hypothetical protein [Streptomyces canus]